MLSYPFPLVLSHTVPDAIPRIPTPLQHVYAPTTSVSTAAATATATATTKPL